jgi:hypothetical protein
MSSAPEQMLNMGIRVLRGDPVSNRGPHPLPSFETVFTMKEGARSVFPPYSVCRIYEDYRDWKYALEQVGIEEKSEKYPVKSPFPPEATDKKEIARPDLIPEGTVKERLGALGTWSLEVIELIGSIEDEKIQARALKTFDRFFETTPPAPAQEPEAAAEVEEEEEEEDSSSNGKSVKGKKRKNNKKKKKAEAAYVNPMEEELLHCKAAIRASVVKGWKEPRYVLPCFTIL